MCPIIITGDIFDDGWRANRCPPELINFALTHIPRYSYAIPGQHDLPHHRYDDIKRSAYWTLVEAGVIFDMPPGQLINIRDQSPRLRAVAFPWGHALRPHQKKSEGVLYLAVVHKYVWSEGHAFPGAPLEAHIDEVVKKLKGFDCAVFGDNHKGFLHAGRYLNGGTFMCRKIDENLYKPSIGLLLDDGSWRQHYLNIDRDICEIHTEAGSAKNDTDFESLLQTLTDLSGNSLDFYESVKFYCKKNKVRQPIQDVITRCIGGK